MNAHVRDRLSPYLDREIPPAEMAEVEAHLRGCEACRRHLETLAAVDAAARALPAAAPPSYFDALPGKIRARIEAGGAVGLAPERAGGRIVPIERPRGRAPFRPPAWTWAVAAALVLAVVTPLTLMRPGASAPAPVPDQAPATVATPSAAEGRTSLTHARRAEDARAVGESGRQEDAAKLDAPGGRGVTGFAPGPIEVKPPVGWVAGGPATARDRASAAPPKAAADAPVDYRSRPEGAPSFAAEPAVTEARAPAAPVPAEVRPLPTPAPTEARPAAQAPARPYAAQPALAGQAAGGASPSREDERAAQEAKETRAREEPPAVASPMAKSARERDTASPRAGAVLSDATLAASADEAAYRRLLPAPPEAAAALRSRREGWRAFAARYPDSRHADEARVRVVETGAAAWRLGSDPRDLVRVRADAAAYLDRGDAAQAARVRQVLATLPPAP